MCAVKNVTKFSLVVNNFAKFRLVTATGDIISPTHPVGYSAFWFRHVCQQYCYHTPHGKYTASV